MKLPKDPASAILREYVHAEAELIGKAVVLADGIGTVDGLFLDELGCASQSPATLASGRSQPSSGIAQRDLLTRARSPRKADAPVEYRPR
jgi:hypothetical protein